MANAQNPLADKQLEFIINSTKRWNLAEGSVRAGKTEATIFRFMQAAFQCPDSNIWMVGHSSQTIYDNCIRLILENERFGIFRPFCTWFPGKRQLHFGEKVISTLGAKDEGAIGSFQGKTFSLVYCDEMTLYPESIIDMIDSRLSLPHSMGFASMNPSYPSHKLKQWIDKAAAGDPNYYSCHFTIDDNPFLPDDYKQRLKESMSGLFYKRYYLGLWCLAEGAVFDFFDKKIHVTKEPPCAAEYWVAGIDYGMSNPCACVLVGVNSGKSTQTGKKLWVEKEYYWNPDSKFNGRQKTVSEFARDIAEFLEPYGVKNVYIDPSATALKLDLERLGVHCTPTENDVLPGIEKMTSEMAQGNLTICASCQNLIREIESYVWHPRCNEIGVDKPLKQNDHAIDALRYIMYSHKIASYQPYKTSHNAENYMQSRFNAGPRKSVFH